MSLGQRVRELRKAAGVDQATLAGRVDARVARGFVPTYLSKIENDRVPSPSLDVIAVLAGELGADVDELCLLAGRVAPDLLAALGSTDIETVRAVRRLVVSHG